MTRLTSVDVESIPSSIKSYDMMLRKKIGVNICKVAAHAAGFMGDPAIAFDGLKAKAVPMTSGKGIIDGFAQAVASILNHIGLETKVASKKDVGGIAEAFKDGVSMIFTADDESFVGLSLRNSKVSYNYDATGRSYAAALEMKIHGLAGKRISLVGVGRVGNAAAEYMCRKGTEIFAYDLLGEKVDALTKRLPLSHKCASVEECIVKGDHVVLTAPGNNFITARMIKEEAVFAAPAIPLGLTKAALRRLGDDRLVHDTLALGVATMAFDLVRRDYG